MRAYQGIEDALALGRGTERSFICHVHEDHNASASVNALSGAWICYACGAKGKVDVDNVEVPAGVVLSELTRLDETINSEPITYSEGWLNLFDATGPGEYWLSRFGEQTCRHFRLGYDPSTNAATYPLRSIAGAVTGVVRRSLLPDGPKYLYPRGTDVSKLLFNYHGCNGDVVILVEGATDAIAAYEAGYESMAIYGSHLSRAHIRLLNAYSPKRIIAAFDQDKAGEQAYEAVRRAFGVIVERPHWAQYKDLSEAPLEARQEILRTAVDGRNEAVLESYPCGSNERQSRPPKTSSSNSARRRIRLRTLIDD